MMKTFVRIALILMAGIGMGLMIRGVRNGFRDGRNAVPPGETVYRDDQPFDADAAVNDMPSKPPADEAWLSRFELIERSGKTVSSEQLKGQPYVVSFFFSTCPSICVRQNQKLKELQDEFAGQGVKFVAISVDPETDTPEILREYATRMGADQDQWLFLTGELPYIRRVGAEIFRQPVDQKFHTERFALVAPDGSIEGFYNWPEDKQFAKLKQRIGQYLSEPPTS